MNKSQHSVLRKISVNYFGENERNVFSINWDIQWYWREKSINLS